jgi:hypothetical protein
LIIGDGRTEIKAGVEMGCVTMSRLSKTDIRQREIQTELKTNMIVEDYTDSSIKKMFYVESK